jgi:hypothetical protein
MSMSQQQLSADQKDVWSNQSKRVTAENEIKATLPTKQIIYVIASYDFMEVMKAKVAGSMPTRLAFPEPVAEGFQIEFLTTLESLILRPLHCAIVLSFLQHLHCCMLSVS